MIVAGYYHCLAIPCENAMLPNTLHDYRWYHSKNYVGCLIREIPLEKRLPNKHTLRICSNEKNECLLNNTLLWKNCL